MYKGKYLTVVRSTTQKVREVRGRIKQTPTTSINVRKKCEENEWKRINKKWKQFQAKEIVKSKKILHSLLCYCSIRIRLRVPSPQKNNNMKFSLLYNNFAFASWIFCVRRTTTILIFPKTHDDEILHSFWHSLFIVTVSYFSPLYDFYTQRNAVERDSHQS